MKWKRTWGCLPIDYNTEIGIVENITQRTHIKNNISGQKVKFKFSNRYSTKPLIMESVIIGKRKEQSDKIAGNIQVTYKGRTRIELEPFQEYYSDEISFEIEAGDWIELSIYVKERTEIRSACATWAARSWNTVYGLEGDHTREQSFQEKKSHEIYPYVDSDINKASIVFGVSSILLLTKESIKTVAFFGDSITHMSYCSDALAERFYEELKGKMTIVNCGIGGNRILEDSNHVEGIPGFGKCCGKAAVLRFEEDVFGSKDVDAVIILEGINDILHPFSLGVPEQSVTAKQLIAGMEQLVQIAQKHGADVYIGTLMPFRYEAVEWASEADTIRNQFNQWIREQKSANGMIDFEEVIKQKENSQYMIESYHMGDGLHPGIEGGKAMAEIIPIAWFL